MHIRKMLSVSGILLSHTLMRVSSTAGKTHQAKDVMNQVLQVNGAGILDSHIHDSGQRAIIHEWGKHTLHYLRRTRLENPAGYLHCPKREHILAALAQQKWCAPLIFL